MALIQFVGAYLLRAGYLHLDFGRYPVWYLFFLIGIVAALGGVVALLFTADEGAPEPAVPRSPPEPPVDDLNHGAREMGRPYPEVTSPLPGDAPWREVWPDDVSTTPPAPTVTLPGVGRFEPAPAKVEVAEARWDRATMGKESAARAQRTQSPGAGLTYPSKGRGPSPAPTASTANLDPELPPYSLERPLLRRPTSSDSMESVLAELDAVASELGRSYPSDPRTKSKS